MVDLLNIYNVYWLVYRNYFEKYFVVKNNT
ncbi:unnamed protein product [Schistosoma margrebowiei]|uniref:Uncharacterized protein n=1 Tax=Schistosoma margrebowiei TaxID=48269 RepID=A0A3P8IKV9_9TREM|nr:unnamed protein product [Schistosoma margrebowiei]